MNDHSRRRVLWAKRTVDFIRSHPEGVTCEMFKMAGIPMLEMDRLLRLKLIVGKQVKEPDRGPRCFHWVWFPVSVDHGGMKGRVE